MRPPFPEKGLCTLFYFNLEYFYSSFKCHSLQEAALNTLLHCILLLPLIPSLISERLEDRDSPFVFASMVPGT